MSTKSRTRRTLYQLFVLGRSASHFYRFAWEGSEEHASLKRAADLARSKPEDPDVIIVPLPVLSKVERRYLSVDCVHACARCRGKGPLRRNIQFDFQQDKAARGKPFFVTMIVVFTCLESEACQNPAQTCARSSEAMSRSASAQEVPCKLGRIGATPLMKKKAVPTKCLPLSKAFAMAKEDFLLRMRQSSFFRAKCGMIMHRTRARYRRLLKSIFTAYRTPSA